LHGKDADVWYEKQEDHSLSSWLDELPSLSSSFRVFMYNGDLDFSVHSILDPSNLQQTATALLHAISLQVEKGVRVHRT
jgi:hypothetical protein